MLFYQPFCMLDSGVFDGWEGTDSGVEGERIGREAWDRTGGQASVGDFVALAARVVPGRSDRGGDAWQLEQ